jgi:hypothetical protein
MAVDITFCDQDCTPFALECDEQITPAAGYVDIHPYAVGDLPPACETVHRNGQAAFS